MLKAIKAYAPFVFFAIGVSLISILLYFDIGTIIIKNANDSFSIALALFAVYGYYKISSNNYRKNKFLDRIEKVRHISGNSGAVIIAFGKDNVISDATNFIKTNIKINEHLIVSRKFGEKNIVDKDDIVELEDFLHKEVLIMLSNVDKVHLFVGGASIAHYVCADILSNWKQVIVYHFDKGEYKPWYIDKKYKGK